MSENSPQNRFICTKEKPWTEAEGRWATHPDAEDIGERDFGGGEYCVHYRCPNCGHSFYVELPQ